MRPSPTGPRRATASRATSRGVPAALAALVALVAGSTILVPGVPPGAGSASAVGVVVSVGSIDANGLVGHIGVDVDGERFGYELVRYWDAAGSADDFAIPEDAEWARFELYPDSHAYDPWTLEVGGAHIHRDPSMGPGWATLGDITLPALGEEFDGAVGFRIDGSIASVTDVPDGRVEIDAFQLGIAEYDPFIPPLPRNSAGVEIGSFATSVNRGPEWTAGVGWPGRYVLFIRDTATGRNIQAIADLAPGSVPTIDLDAVCFGFHTCQYDQGAPGTPAGAFHPLTPTRILDTRARLGIRNGPVRTGGGWSDSPSRSVRHDEAVNHELKVTGRYGVPATGVSAVLLNVVAVDAPAPGFIAVRPRRPSCCSELAIHDDRSAMDPGAPATSNLNVGAVDAVANLVLARVGAGGTINLYNSLGPTHVVADVAGWFDAGTGTFGFSAVAPARVLDTRDGTGAPAARVEVGEARTIDLGDLPAGTAAVVVNITATQSAGAGYVRAFPTGVPMPPTSSLNFTGRADRANLAVIPVGAGGAITVRVDDAATHLVVDLVGVFVPAGGRTTAVEPVRFADSRAGLGVPAGKVAGGGAVTVQVAGVGPVPSDATAAVLDVTVTQAEGAGFAAVHAGGTPPPPTSNLNYAGDDVAGLVYAALGVDGSVAVDVSGAAAHVIVDVLGFVTA